MKDLYKTIYPIFSIVLALFIFVSLIICGGTITGYAQSSSIVDEYESSNVLDDLQKSVINGKDFNITNFPFDNNRDTELLSFIEYCYSYDENRQNDYGLYVYIYNPKGINYDCDSTLNTISLAVADTINNESVEFNYYPLKFLNCSTTLGYEGLFHKFKVVLSDSDKATILSTVKSIERVYKIRQLNLLVQCSTNPTAIAGSTYAYSGYAKGYGSSFSENDSLVCSVTELTAISPTVHHTYFRPNGSNGKNSYTQDTLSSVYFSVPNDLFQNGELSNIRATWLKTMSRWSFVTGDKLFYDFAKSYMGYDVSNFGWQSVATSNPDIAASIPSFNAWEKSNVKYGLNKVSDMRIYACDYMNNNSMVFDYGLNSPEYTDMGLFGGLYFAGEGLENADDFAVSSDDLFEQMQNYDNDFSLTNDPKYKNSEPVKFPNGQYSWQTYYTYQPYFNKYVEADGKVFPYNRVLFEAVDEHI